MWRGLSKRQRFVLAALATDASAKFAPVQVQKLFFLLDENLADVLGEPQFEFRAYDYGPFDKAVYRELEALNGMGLVDIVEIGPTNGRRRYSLTPRGQEFGESALAGFPEPVREYIRDLSNWLRRLSFAQLVGSIYKAYPHMRENSIFQD
jgi:hypothetical protein